MSKYLSWDIEEVLRMHFDVERYSKYDLGCLILDVFEIKIAQMRPTYQSCISSL
jgi:hypothetical protein